MIPIMSYSMGTSSSRRNHATSPATGLVLFLIAVASCFVVSYMLWPAEAFVGPMIVAHGCGMQWATESRIHAKTKPAASPVSTAARVKDYDPLNPSCEVLQIFFTDILYGKKSEERTRVLLANLGTLEECFLKENEHSESVSLYLAHIKHRLTGETEQFLHMDFDSFDEE